jgi:hypothetical protein
MRMGKLIWFGSVVKRFTIILSACVRGTAFQLSGNISPEAMRHLFDAESSKTTSYPRFQRLD